MPYIDPMDRAVIDTHLRELRKEINTPGKLNYVCCSLALWLALCLSGGWRSYTALSAARGALSDAADEFYRRVMAPHEDQKIQENGDVF